MSSAFVEGENMKEGRFRAPPAAPALGRRVTCAAVPPHVPGHHIRRRLLRYLHGQLWNENQEGLRQQRMM